MKKIYLLTTIFLLGIIISVSSFGADKKILVVYFSRADENYSVGVIDKGNTEIIAEIIAKETGGDLFKIEPVKAYPKNYNETVKIARQEKKENAHPKIKNKVNNLKDYDIVFLGYPIWWEDLPMPVYTFLGENNLSGKIIIPFSTHEGSGIANTIDTLTKLTKGNVVKVAFSERGSKVQKSQEKIAVDVKEWLKHLKNREDTGNLKELLKYVS